MVLRLRTINSAALLCPHSVEGAGKLSSVPSLLSKRHFRSCHKQQNEWISNGELSRKHQRYSCRPSSSSKIHTVQSIIQEQQILTSAPYPSTHPQNTPQLHQTRSSTNTHQPLFRNLRSNPIKQAKHQHVVLHAYRNDPRHSSPVDKRDSTQAWRNNGENTQPYRRRYGRRCRSRCRRGCRVCCTALLAQLSNAGNENANLTLCTSLPRNDGREVRERELQTQAWSTHDLTECEEYGLGLVRYDVQRTATTTNQASHDDDLTSDT